MIAQLIGGNQIVQGRVLLRLGRIPFSSESQFALRAKAQRVSPGIKLGAVDHGKDAGDGEIVTTPRFGVRRVAIKCVQRITRRAYVALECSLWLRPRQSLGAIDRLRDGLIRSGCRLESSRWFLRNNGELRAAAERKRNEHEEYAGVLGIHGGDLAEEDCGGGGGEDKRNDPAAAPVDGAGLLKPTWPCRNAKE